MSRILMFCCFIFSGIQFASAATDAAATPTEAELVPDAMQHMVKAPEIDFANLRDPFASYLALVARRGRAILDDQRLRLENRDREILENFDLTTLKLVGVYSMGKDQVAMIEDATGAGYTVRRGNYMGKNSGRIEKIDSSTLYLVEQIINPAGDVVDHQVTLTLKEINE
ncbi:MAG: pilus assembly protein PilP [Mariprofundaceae bacterium]